MKELQLSQGKVALLDDEDYLAALPFRWSLAGSPRKQTRYAKHSELGFLHRFVMERNGYDIRDKVVDHINGNGLDNQKSNLRLATQSQNHHNSKVYVTNKVGHRGVYCDSRTGKWNAEIKVDGETHVSRYFTSLREASIARDIMATRLVGEFAAKNVPDATEEEIKMVTEKIDRPKLKKQTSSLFIGVIQEVSGKWKTYVMENGKRKVLGRFASERKAAEVRECYLLKNPNLESSRNFILVECDRLQEEIKSENFGRGLSKYRGVSFYKRTGKWFAQIRHGGKNHNLGSFDTEKEAAIAYNEQAKIVWGDRAKLNHITHESHRV